MRALSRYVPVRWHGRRVRKKDAEMTAMASAVLPRSVLDQIGDRMAKDTTRSKALETEAEQLQREVHAAVARNSNAVDHSKLQAQQVKSFEERSRDTLRDLMTDMGRRDGIRD